METLFAAAPRTEQDQIIETQLSNGFVNLTFHVIERIELSVSRLREVYDRFTK